MLRSWKIVMLGVLGMALGAAAAPKQPAIQLGDLNIEGLHLAIQDLSRTWGDRYPKAGQYLQRLDDLNAKATRAQAAQLPAIAAEIEKLRAEALLASPAIDFDRLLLVKRSAKKMGLPQNWQGNCAVARDGYENEIAVLSPVSPDGKLTTLFKPKSGEFVGDVDLHFDAGKMLFSMPGSHGRWQIFEMNVDGGGLRQATPGEEPDVDNYDPCYLPNGRIMYASTMAFHGVPCVGGANTVANMAVMDADGKNIRQLSFDQDHNWCPTVMNDGRIMYSRWEYSDTAHYFSRLLFRMNPDGTAQMEMYGSNSYWPNSLFYARPIPNHPTKVVAIVSGHHGVARMGELVVLDVARGRFEADGAVQRIPGYNKTVPPVIADQLVNGSWPRFLHPYPLSEKQFLVSMQPKGGNWGVYLVDVFDNMVLLHEEPGQAMLEPLPLRKTVRPPVVPDRVDVKSRDAVVYLQDVYLGPGLKDVPRGTVKKLRIYEYHYAYPRMGGHINVGVEGPWDVHRILGTVPVNEDGSAVFKVPANTPLAVQPLDADGKALQVMRSWFSAMPGEVLSCVGCHEKQNDAPPAKLAAQYGKPAEITPWYGPTRGFSFKREVQPVLDQYCVGCHNGQPYEGKATLNLARSDKNGWSNFTPSYLALHPYVRRPGPESDYHIQIPLEWNADTSELVQLLKKGHYNVKLDAESWERLYCWIDLNVPDHGTWSEHRAIPNNFDQRRLAMRTKYANRPENPEEIPDLKQALRAFVKPQPLPQRKAEAIALANWPLTEERAKKLQQAAGPVARRTLDLGEGVTMEMVLIPAGEFVMGSADGALDESPMTRVRIERPFWMSATEVTNRQYARFDPAHHSGFIDQHHKDHTTPGYPAYQPDQPVIRMSWHKAVAFTQWLSRTQGTGFNLPTEAQWEWACRAGSGSAFSYGTADTDFAPFANLADQSIRLLAVSGVNPQPIKNPNANQDFLPKDVRFNDGEKIVCAVGKYKPNAWGLFDMHGNVAEWTRTAMRPYPYREDDGRSQPKEGDSIVVRGGSFYDRPARATASYRLGYRPYAGVWNVGIRVICE